MSETGEMARRVGDLGLTGFDAKLKTGIGIEIGPFAAHITAQSDSLVEPLQTLYRDYPLLADDNLFSFHVRLDERRGMFRPHKRRVRFLVDGVVPHEDMPATQALPVLEWGINLVTALRFHCYLMLHAAVVERGGHAMLLPAAPGHGKSTLCAGLALRGFRLLSDEFGLLRPGEPRLIPVPRPMALKNESIEVIRRFAPGAVIGPSFPNTRKGTVAHVKPPEDSVMRAGEHVSASWIVFPRWQPDAACRLTEIPKADGFMLLATNAFNYELLGEAAFRTITALVDQSRCFQFAYTDLDDAVEMLTDLVEGNVD